MTTTPLPPLPLPKHFVPATETEYWTADQMQAHATAARADLEAEVQRLREALAQIKATKPLARAMKSEWCPAATGMVRVASAALEKQP